jgi:hypothetical protein
MNLNIKYKYPIIIAFAILIYGIVMFYLRAFYLIYDDSFAPNYFKFTNTLSYIFNFHIAFAIFYTTDSIANYIFTGKSFLIVMAIIPIFGFVVNYTLLTLLNLASFKGIKLIKPDIDENGKLIASVLMAVPIVVIAGIILLLTGH